MGCTIVPPDITVRTEISITTRTVPNTWIWIPTDGRYLGTSIVTVDLYQVTAWVSSELRYSVDCIEVF